MIPTSTADKAEQKIRHDPRTGLKTPCVYICTIDGLTGYCLGCFRTRAEVESWTKMTEAARDDALSKFDERKAHAAQKRQDYMAQRKQDAAAKD